MLEIVNLMDTVLCNPEDESSITSVRKKVNDMMTAFPLFAY